VPWLAAGRRGGGAFWAFSSVGLCQECVAVFAGGGHISHGVHRREGRVRRAQRRGQTPSTPAVAVGSSPEAPPACPPLPQHAGWIAGDTGYSQVAFSAKTIESGDGTAGERRESMYRAQGVFFSQKWVCMGTVGFWSFFLGVSKVF
jgi:hypothetical protein